MRGLTIAAIAGATLVAGCTAPEKQARYMAGHYKAQAELKTPDGTRIGTAVAEEVDGAIRVMVEVAGLPKGVHGTHVHAIGKCEAPDFASAGPHWNPSTHQHGKDNPMGPHAGDLPNLSVGDDGRDTTIFTLPEGTYAGLLDADGAALVVHAGPDDYKTDPSGNSGGRIACGVFQAM
jgi:superoxide dismutase, Cu-Zn family